MVEICRGSAAALLAAAVFSAGPAAAAVVYVSADHGSDQASGLAREAPLRSLALAAGRLHPGDRLVIESGRYDEPLHLSKSGTAAAPIEVAGGDGPLPQIRSATDAVTIAADYIQLSRIDAASSGDLGSAIVIQTGHHHVTIADSVAHDSGCGGIGGLQTDYVVIRHNRVFGNGSRSPWQCSGISLYQATNIDEAPGFHNVITGNLVYGNLNKQPDPKLPAAAAGHTTDGNGIILDDFRHTQIWQGRKTGPYRSASLIENNVVYDNGGRGIEVFYSDDATISGNTVRHDLLDPLMVPAPYGEIYVAFADRVDLFNNLIDTGKRDTVAVMAAEARGGQADYNVTVGGDPLGRRNSDLRWGQHNIAAPTAGFADAQKDDLHLTAASPALGRASREHASATDLDGVPRPGSGTVDTGAYQFRR